MCGIAGSWSRHGSATPDSWTHAVRTMLDAIRHRGPDGEGVTTGGGCVLGAVRLAVMDPEHGAQPMWTADGRCCVALNGEIVNHVELREQLESRGARFRTRCDTEVVLELLARDGIEGLARIDGMFALAFLNTGCGELLLVRDPCGIKPLYWYADAERVLFASEPKALVAVDGVEARLNEQSLLDYLAFQLPLCDDTFFAGVRRVAPGSVLRLRRGEEPCVLPLPAWHAPTAVPADVDEAAAGLRRLLGESVVRHLRSDVPLGAHLSGGVDSSLVAALAARALDHPIHVFTGAFDAAGFDERVHSRAVAAEIGAIVHEVVQGPEEAAAALLVASVAMDEPMAGPGLLPQWAVSELASRHVKVALGGQGGDELFGGYVRHLVVELAEQVRMGAHSIQSAIAAHSEVLAGYESLLTHFAASGGWSADTADAYYLLHARGEGLSDVLSGDLGEAVRRHPARSRFRARFEAVAGRDAPEQRTAMGDAARFDRAVLLPALLHVEDRTSMAWSLESRVPLLGREVLAFVGQLPDALLVGEGRPKSFLRRAISGDLPDAAAARGDKMGFPVPLAVWARGPLRGFLHDLLLDGTARSRGLFEPGAVRRLIDGESVAARHLWALVNVELWMRNNAA